MWFTHRADEKPTNDSAFDVPLPQSRNSNSEHSKCCDSTDQIPRQCRGSQLSLSSGLTLGCREPPCPELHPSLRAAPYSDWSMQGYKGLDSSKGPSQLPAGPSDASCCHCIIVHLLLLPSLVSQLARKCGSLECSL